MSTVTFTSGTLGLAVATEWDETILDALLRSGAPVPFYCRSGICGQCKSQLLAGTVEDVGVAPQLLTPAEAAQGMVLLCRSRPLTDCEVRPIQAIAAQGPPPWPERCVVEAVAPLGTRWLHLRIGALGPGKSFAFRAGQYSRLEGAGSALAAEHLFLASRPGLAYADFYLPCDVSTCRAMADLQPGKVVLLTAPTGSASLRDSEPGPVTVVAEGSGVASALGMVEAVSVPAPTAPDIVFLVHGVDDGLLERMLTGVARKAGIRVVIAASREAVAAALDERLRESSAPASDVRMRTYIKAGRETTRSVRQVLLQHGVRPWDTYVDNVADSR